MNYRLTYGRTDGSATKRTTSKSRLYALKLANNMAFVMFKKHPFKNATTRGKVRAEGNGYFVEFEEVDEDVPAADVPMLLSKPTY
jgi:hypothetical protein